MLRVGFLVVGLIFAVMHGLLIAVTSLVAEHRLEAHRLSSYTVQVQGLADFSRGPRALVALRHVESSQTRD